MSKLRRESAKFLGKGPNGRNLCSCGCGREVLPPKRNWFSQECVDDWRVRNDPAYARQKVFERDHGICAECGVDTEKLRRSASKFGCSYPVPNPWQIAAELGYESPYQDETGRALWDYKPDVEAALVQADYLREEVESEWKENCELWREEAARLGFPKDTARTWHEADHIIPVIEGGGQCGLDNYRTLCIPCHKKATKELAARRAQARREKKNPDVAAGIEGSA